MRTWIDGKAATIDFIFHNEVGRIVGEVGRVGFNSYHYATVYDTESNNSKGLGHYISSEWAKHAVENFWEIQDRTLLENE
jgi:hypothetical protein